MITIIDVLLIILKDLKIKEVINLFRTSKSNYKLLESELIKINDTTSINLVYDTFIYNYCTSLIISDYDVIYLNGINNYRYKNDINIKDRYEIKLPKHIKKLYIGNVYTNNFLNLKNTNDNLEIIIDGSIKNITINKCLSLTYISRCRTYEDNYDNIKNLNKIQGIERLEFNNSFNIGLKGLLPRTLKYLKFGTNFNRMINGKLPDTLEYLIFGYKFNKLLEKTSLPKSLTHLQLGRNFKQNLKDCLPDSLKYLKIDETYEKDKIKGSLPDSLITLVISDMGYYGEYDYDAINISGEELRKKYFI